MDHLLLQQVAEKFIGLGCSSGVVSCQILLERCKIPVSKEKNYYKPMEKWEKIVRGTASKYKHKGLAPGADPGSPPEAAPPKKKKYINVSGQ